MDSQSACGNRSAADQKASMIDYCLNQMTKRTVDEQLNDFASLMGTAVKLNIVYKKTGLEVRYEIGSVQASVSGFEESTCVEQCKLEVLHSIRTYCNFTDGLTRCPPDFVRKNEKTDKINNCRDIYSETALTEHNSTRGTERKVTELALIDPDMASSVELSKFVDTDKEPLVLRITYFQTGLETKYEIGTNSSFTIGTTESKCIRECKRQLLPKLGVFPYSLRTPTNRDVTCSDKPRNTMTRFRSVAEGFAERASKVMESLVQQDFTESTNSFLDILLEANNASVQCLGHVTDCLVRKAIHDPENITIYAKLCSDANIRALDDPGNSRLGFPEKFKNELMRSCGDALRAAGVLPQAKQSPGPRLPIAQRLGTRNANTRKSNSIEGSVETADGGTLRTLATCRFISELYMQYSFKMLPFVLGTINTFLRARDAKSLECLCEMLTIIGPKLENLNVDRYDAEHVYARLTSYSQLRSADNGYTLLPRRTMTVIDRVLDERKCRQPRNALPSRSDNRGNRDREHRRGPPRNENTGPSRALFTKSWRRK